MEKVQAIGAPFVIEHSSCSDLKPKRFQWTLEDCPIKVFIDGAIMSGIEYVKKEGEVKVAWVCESRTIFHTMHVPHDTWMNNLEKICEHYDAVFTSERELLSIHPKIQFAYAGSNLPWIKPLSEDMSIEKTKQCSIIASSKNYAYGHKLRNAIATTFKDVIDIYGGVNDSPRISGIDAWDKTPGLKDYMFSFVVENDSYTTYYTEKLTDCFMVGTIPIYWGAPDIGDIFDINGFVLLSPNFDVTILTKELFESKIESALKNYQTCIDLQMADDYLYSKIKQL
jgi:hypothetical protein